MIKVQRRVIDTRVTIHGPHEPWTFYESAIYEQPTSPEVIASATCTCPAVLCAFTYQMQTTLLAQIPIMVKWHSLKQALSS